LTFRPVAQIPQKGDALSPQQQLMIRPGRHQVAGSDGAAADQILGFGAELFWNFGEFGVLFGYVLLGLWALDERSRRSDLS
jgi:hypothetical protein